MVVITLLFTRNYFPPEQAAKAGKMYIEWLKDNPPDPTVDKTLCILVLSAEDGNIMVVGIGQRERKRSFSRCYSAKFVYSKRG